MIIKKRIFPLIFSVVTALLLVSCAKSTEPSTDSVKFHMDKSEKRIEIISSGTDETYADMTERFREKFESYIGYSLSYSSEGQFSENDKPLPQYGGLYSGKIGAAETALFSAPPVSSEEWLGEYYSAPVGLWLEDDDGGRVVLSGVFAELPFRIDVRADGGLEELSKIELRILLTDEGKTEILENWIAVRDRLKAQLGKPGYGSKVGHPFSASEKESETYISRDISYMENADFSSDIGIIWRVGDSTLELTLNSRNGEPSGITVSMYNSTIPNPF